MEIQETVRMLDQFLVCHRDLVLLFCTEYFRVSQVDIQIELCLMYLKTLPTTC